MSDTQRKRGRPKLDNPTTQVAVRFDAALLARLDAYTAQLQEAHPGLRINRSAAIRTLLLNALPPEKA